MRQPHGQAPGGSPRSTAARAWPSIAASCLLAASLACSAPLERRDGSAGSPDPGAGRLQNIDHLTPPRDSVGGVPSRFAWTPVEGADAYAIGVWSEVDVLMWRADEIRAASIAAPVDLRLEPGTYFWSVTAMRGNQAVAESGRAAFIVR